MERSETLTRLRGEGQRHSHRPHDERKKVSEDETWDLREERFPSYFLDKAPENAQKIILWCLSPNPARRPTASELLKVRMRC